MVIITGEYLKEKIDEYAYALRHNSEDVSILRQEALQNIAKYVKEYNLGRDAKREFNLAYTESANYMMRTYVRVFGELTQKVEVSEPVKILYQDIGKTHPCEVSFRYVIDELIKNDLPDKIKRPYSKDRFSQRCYDNCAKAYKIYLRKKGFDAEGETIQTKTQNLTSPKIDIEALLDEDLNDLKKPAFPGMKKKLKAVSRFISEKRKAITSNKRESDTLTTEERNARDAILYEKQLQELKDKEKKKAERLASRQNKRNNSTNSSNPKAKKSFTKAAVITLALGTGVTGIFGINRVLKNNQNNADNNDYIKAAKVENPRHDTPAKDTLSLILANKQAYQQQVRDTMPVKKISAESKTDNKSSKANPVSKPVAKVTVKDKKTHISEEQQGNNTAIVLSDTVSVVPTDSINAVLADTLSIENDSLSANFVLPDTVADSIRDTSLIIDSLDAVRDTSVISDTSYIIADSITNNADTNIAVTDSAMIQTAAPEDSIYNTDSIYIDSPEINTDPVNDTVSIQKQDGVSEIQSDEVTSDSSIFANNEHFALDEMQSAHIDVCDDVLTTVCGSPEMRDSLYRQIERYIDSGNFMPPYETHIKDVTANIVYMSISSNKRMREIGEKILSGEKITPEQQEIVNTIKPWNTAIPKIIKAMGVQGLYFAPEKSVDTLMDVGAAYEQTKNNGAYSESRESNKQFNNSVGCRSHKSHKSKRKELLQRILVNRSQKAI